MVSTEMAKKMVSTYVHDSQGEEVEEPSFVENGFTFLGAVG